ncbi:TPA: hypothetical protein U1359_001682 [Streptococcus suis]|nr:hypothetical protein [Streptococcus suis]
MLDKLKSFLGLDEYEVAGPQEPANNLIEVRALQAENRELKEIIRKQRALLQELSEENMELGRDRQVMANTIADQHRRIEVYKRQLV